MLEVVVEETMNCAPDDFLEFVLDVHRYAEVDDKIGAIDWARREGDRTDFRFRPVLPGIPGPAPKMVMRVQRAGDTIEMSMTPLPHNRFIRHLVSFGATFEAAPVDGGTLVRSVTSMNVTPVARWPMEAILRRTLPDNIRAELDRAAVYLDRQTARKQRLS
ncbi:SRPBCC family protein [Actinophytocola gossypii]|uniref:SRPBCC family protein n=1 Tax=Actinophytocola gossypii TaxID=2812003 RepID=A0ABT2J795_9PSEU|nr:SRPBCC family protein [Actinophytocola gossypii]MCT2583668.1 SRPBCC family protein [Actinophytocola gossypii]